MGVSVFPVTAVGETALGMVAPGSIGSQRSFLFHGSLVLRSGGRLDLCLHQIDSEQEPDEKLLRPWESSQVGQNDKEKRQNSKGVTNVAMRAPVRLPGEEAETHQENLDQNGRREQPGSNQVQYPCPFNHKAPPLRDQRTQ